MMYATVRDVTGTRTFIEKLIAESKIPLLEFSSPLPPKNNPPPCIYTQELAPLGGWRGGGEWEAQQMF